MKIIKKNIVNLMLIIATCTMFSMASACEINTAKTASQYKVTTQSSPAVKMVSFATLIGPPKTTLMGPLKTL